MTNQYNNIEKDSSQFSVDDLELLQYLLESDETSPTGETAIPRRKNTDESPLSFAQQRLWLLQQLEPKSPVYNVPVALRISGKLHVQGLERAFNEIVRRHDVLRVAFAKEEAGLKQVPVAEVKVEIPVVSLEHEPPDEMDARALRRVNEFIQRPFDLGKAPLLSTMLLKLADEVHVFVFVMHHIISDGWSMGVFIRELTEVYDGFANDSELHLDELKLQYADFAAWQKTWMKGESQKKQLTYWKKQLGGTLPVLELPIDHQRPSIQTSCGALATIKISSSTLAALNRLSQECGATLFMSLLAGFKALLNRYSGQEDCIVGTAVANRNRAELEGMLGFFVNTLVLRTALTGNPEFRELLNRVRITTMDAYDHQDLPFEKLVEEIKPDRDVSRTPLFQVMFAFQNAPTTAWSLPGLELTALEVHNGMSKFDLTLSSEEQADGVLVTAEYNTDLFDAVTIERFLAHYQQILQSAVANPNQRLSDLALLTDFDRHQLLNNWNATHQPFQSKKCIHELVELQAINRPESVAAVLGDKQLTYGELNRRANQLAHYLLTKGIGPEDLVAVCFERNLLMLVAMLATLKTGGAYLPIDPTYPIERIGFMLEDSKARIVLTQEHLLKTLPPEISTSLCLDRDWPNIAREKTENPEPVSLMEHMAYLIYTSGSTGRPKGVAIPHKSLLNLVHWHQTAFEVTSHDRATQIATTAFDASVWEIWPYLSAGACLFLAPMEVLTSPDALQMWLISNKINISFVPTPLAEPLLKMPWPATVALRALLTGGDKLHEFPGAGLPFGVVNNYGPTENAVVTTSGWIENKEGAGAPEIGRAIANTEVYLLDKHLNLVPVGVAGELCIGGSSLARGYLNRPDLTAEKFIPNPFTTQPGERLYKTGDLARFSPEGNIHFVGRIDHQVKIRGFRIELGEIEATLEKCSSVDTAIVVVHKNKQGDQRLVAYILSKHDEQASAEHLKQTATESLPGYMVPGIFINIESLPLTANGKIDRGALPKPDTLQPGLGTDFVAPETEIERKIAAVWREVLEVEKVGIHDNFFDLGGHSLLLVQIHSRLNEVLNQDMSIVDLFKYPTVGAMTKYFSQSSGDEQDLSKIHHKATKQKHAIRQQTRLKKEVLKYE